MKRIIAVLLFCAFCLCGCAAGSGAVKKEGRRLIKEYFASSGRSAVLEEIHPVILRPDADKLIVSDYAAGSFKRGGETFEFAVNTVTGEIYTSERVPLFSKSYVKLIAEKLGLGPGEYAGRCLLWTHAPAWQKENADYPGKTAYLGSVIPVDVTDTDKYAEEVFENPDIRTDVDIVCTTKNAPDENAKNTVFRKDITVELYILSEPSAKLPSEEELTREYFENFKGEMVSFPSGE